MTGKMYSTSEDAIIAFRSKNLFNKTIRCNLDNPTENDFGSLRELYKVLWMAEYYMWREMGLLRILPLHINSVYICFKIYIKKDYDNSDIWILETNAPSLDLYSIIDLLAKKSTEMGYRYLNIHGGSPSDFIWTKLAGISNRHMPLFPSSLSGEWIGLDIYDYSYFVTTSEEFEAELLDPTLTISFYGDNGCSLGGELGINAICSYDSDYNIIIDQNRRVLAFVVSLDDNILKVVPRYKRSNSGNIIAIPDNELSVVRYMRASDIRKMIYYKK